jgi:hypothetical protein
LPAGAAHLEDERRFRPCGGDQGRQMIGAEERLAIEEDEDIMHPQTGGLGRRPSGDFTDDQPCPLREDEMIAEERGDRHQGHARHGGVAFGGGDLSRGPEVGSGGLGGPCTRRRRQPEERGSQAREGDRDPAGTSGVHRDGVRGAVGRHDVDRLGV